MSEELATTDTSTEVTAFHGFLDVQTGELLEANIGNAAQALNAARVMKQQVNEIVNEITAWAAEESARLGTKTLHGDGETITVTGGASIEYDPLDLVQALEAAGCPTERIDQAVTPEVTFKVNRAVLRQLAAANPDYKAAIELAEREVEKPYRASIKLRRTTDGE